MNAEDKKKEIRKEFNRLKKLLINIDEDKYKTITPLIEKAAFMKVTLSLLQDSINEEGTQTEYKNGENQYGMKVNPDVQTYNSMIKIYSGVMKQLLDLIPKTDEDKEKETTSDLDAFLKLTEAIKR